MEVRWQSALVSSAEYKTPLGGDEAHAYTTLAGHPQQPGNISRLMAISGMRGSPPSMGSAF